MHKGKDVNREEGNKKEFIGDPDILNVLVFEGIWIIHSFFFFFWFIYHPDVRHHGRTTCKPIAANNFAVEKFISLCACPLVLCFLSLSS